ncbi:multiple resistance and pH regulation protein F [Ectothiorhodospiraceae bacterium 2226]|nr:multiple resistance and pH regulation protein F [Ectothiorhodospiraceae bacterium 2226]
MNLVLLAVTVFLLLNVAAGLVRVMRGPTPADRMMAAQLFGTTGVGVLVLLAFAVDQPALLDVALVFALLAALVVAAFVHQWGGHYPDERARNLRGEERE